MALADPARPNRSLDYLPLVVVAIEVILHE
jgi:hypothetical protein